MSAFGWVNVVDVGHGLARQTPRTGDATRLRAPHADDLG